ncbi:MAG: hypothetical protein FWD16_05330 [Clostridia bacterium]|nr:hypothetical protein [Clostridia bacterium]
MSNEKKLTTLQKQLKDKPIIEDVIPKYLDDERKQTALDFVAWLRVNKFNPNLTLHPGWEKVLGKVKWGIQLYHGLISGYKHTALKEGLQSVLWDSVSHCKQCKSCAPGLDVTLLGREFKGICGAYGNNVMTWVYDPDEMAIDKIKRLLELEKAARTSRHSVGRRNPSQL